MKSNLKPHSPIPNLIWAPIFFGSQGGVPCTGKFGQGLIYSWHKNELKCIDVTQTLWILFQVEESPVYRRGDEEESPVY